MLLRPPQWNEGWEPSPLLFPLPPPTLSLCTRFLQTLALPTTATELDSGWHSHRVHCSDSTVSLCTHQGVFLRNTSCLFTLCPFKPSSLSLIFSAKQKPPENPHSPRCPQTLDKGDGQLMGWCIIWFIKTHLFHRGLFPGLIPFCHFTSTTLHGPKLTFGCQKVERLTQWAQSQPACSCYNSTLSQGQCLCEGKVWRPFFTTSASLHYISLPRLDVFSACWWCPRKPCWQVCSAYLHAQLAYQFSEITQRKAVSFCPFVILSSSFPPPVFIIAQSALLREYKITPDLTQARQNQFVQNHLKWGGGEILFYIILVTKKP